MSVSTAKSLLVTLTPLLSRRFAKCLPRKAHGGPSHTVQAWQARHIIVVGKFIVATDHLGKTTAQFRLQSRDCSCINAAVGLWTTVGKAPKRSLACRRGKNNAGVFDVSVLAHAGHD